MNFNKIKKYLPLFGIVMMGLLSAIFIHLYLRNTAKNLERKYANEVDATQVKVVVANHDLPAGSVISMENVSMRAVPREYVHNNALTPEQMDGVFGRKLAEPLAAGKPLLTVFLERPAPKAFSSRLAGGTRAITLTVDEINSISGLLRAGDHIDLLFAPRVGQGQDIEVLPLMQDVIVRATGQMMMEEVQARRTLTAMAQDDDKKNSFATITVAVNQRDAERLVLAQTQGKITAILRNTEDRALENTRVGLPDLVGGKKGPELDDVLFLVGGQNGIQRSVLRTPHPPGRDPSVAGTDLAGKPPAGTALARAR